MRSLTNANMRLQNHADIIGPVSDGKGDRTAFRVLHHFYYLKKKQEKGAAVSNNLKLSTSLMNTYFAHFNRLL